jgi:hypothetical protein
MALFKKSLWVNIDQLKCSKTCASGYAKQVKFMLNEIPNG